jgi:hypothetical protein
MINALAKRLAELEHMATPDLRAKWAQTFGHEAPRQASRGLLLHALAYNIQERTDGGLSASVRRRLVRWAAADKTDPQPVTPAMPRLKPGCHLVREWHGVIHDVTVLDDGFAYKSGHYTSLSAIARRITGSSRSGPLFFGLRKDSVTGQGKRHGG